MRNFTLLLTLVMFVTLAVNAQVDTRSGKEATLDRDYVTISNAKSSKAVVFSEDFESYNYNPDAGDVVTLEDNGWMTYDEDGDTYNWFVIQTEGLTKVATSASWDVDAGALTPDNWLVSPAIDLTAETGALELRWTAFGLDPAYAAEKYQVLISTTGNTVADFTTSVFEETLGDDIYDRAIDISDYAGETIYVAFQHYDITDMYMLCIDNVEVGSPLINVTFNVDMRPAIDSSNFVIGEDTVSMTGSINDWVAPIAGPDYILEDPDGDSIYTTVLALEEGDYEYKYFINSSWDNGEWDGGDNRALSVTAEMTVDDIFGVEPVGISDKPAAIEMNVYPNPSNGIIQVEAEGINTVTVISTIGQIVSSQDFRDQATINLTEQAAGVYFVRVQNGDRTGVRRVVVE